MGRDNITQLLHSWAGGERAALDELIELVYAELRGLARRHMAAERQAHTLQPSALVHEAYMRLAKTKEVPSQNRQQFFAVSARLIRQILVDHARTRDSAKRGGQDRRVMLDTSMLTSAPRNIDVIALEAALGRLAELDPRKAQVVELRLFGGLTVKETAEVMEVGTITVLRDWKFAIAWLRRDIEGSD